MNKSAQILALSILFISTAHAGENTRSWRSCFAGLAYHSGIGFAGGLATGGVTGLIDRGALCIDPNLNEKSPFYTALIISSVASTPILTRKLKHKFAPASLQQKPTTVERLARYASMFIGYSIGISATSK